MKIKNKKGAAGMIIGIIIALGVIGVIIFFVVGSSGGSQPSVGTGTPRDSGGNGGTGGGTPSNNGGEGSGDFSWCKKSLAQANIVGFEFIGMTKFKGKDACHLEYTIPGSNIVRDHYLYSKDVDFCVVSAEPVPQELYTTDSGTVVGCPQG